MNNSFGLQQGQDVILNNTIVDGSGDVLDITGATFRFAMARSPGGIAVIDSAASPMTAVCAIVSASDGTMTVTLKDTDLDGLEGDYYYELKMTDASGSESITNKGWISMQAALT